MSCRAGLFWLRHHDLDKPSDPSLAGLDEAQGPGQTHQEGGLQPALWRSEEAWPAEPPVWGQRDQNQQIYTLVFHPYELIRAVPPYGQRLFCGPGHLEFRPGGERVPAGGGSHSHLCHPGTDCCQGWLGGFPEVPEWPAAQQYALLHIQQVNRPSSSVIMIKLIIFKLLLTYWMNVANKINLLNKWATLHLN